jgi:hypothetical protein
MDWPLRRVREETTTVSSLFYQPEFLDSNVRKKAYVIA